MASEGKTMELKSHWSPPERRKTWASELMINRSLQVILDMLWLYWDLLNTLSYIEILRQLRLFTALVRPHLKYANSVWHRRFKKDVEQLEKVQRFATKLVTSLRDMSYQK